MDVTQIRLVIFDVGQTLLFLTPPSEEVFLARCQQLAIDVKLEDLKRGCKAGELWVAQTIMNEQQGAPRMSDEEFDMKWEYVVLETALKDRKENIEDLVNKLRNIDGPTQNWSAPPETYTVLNELQSKDLPLGIVSNFPKILPDLCRKVGIADYFDFIIASEEVGISKPDPSILQMALQRAQVKPHEAVYIGDHPFDILCAKKVPMPIIWFNKDNDPIPDGFTSYPDFQISALSEIVEIII
ncbi:MAG: HAD family hydrolase [Candidatus Poribacteria bacterium]|nr:HAD family hydrolase [Candidatus Poribacteria bacterium]